MENNKFKENLRRLRAEHGITQRFIADQLGIDRSSYAKYENGQAIPPFHTVIKLSEIFGVSVGYLSGSEDRIKPYNLLSDSDSRLSDEEVQLILSYRTASDEDRQKLLNYAFSLEQDSDLQE